MGRVIVPDHLIEGFYTTCPQQGAIDTRVSEAEHKDNLEVQTKHLTGTCAAKDWRVAAVVKEIERGVTDARPKRLKRLTNLGAEITGNKLFLSTK